jgi:ABC-type transport system substrate-binding protein
MSQAITCLDDQNLKLFIVTDQQQPKELRFKRGSSIMNYIHRFSATEKIVFGALVIMAIASVIVMVTHINNLFLTEVPARGGELREGTVGLPRTINPILAATDIDRDISALIYSGLTKYENGEIVPDIAKEFSISEDGLTYSFTLKPDVYFHDGVKLLTDLRIH